MEDKRLNHAFFLEQKSQYFSLDFVCFFVYSRLSNFSAIWLLSSLLVTGLQI
jgi:hypothetical protein